jgi:MFS family permease
MLAVAVPLEDALVGELAQPGAARLLQGVGAAALTPQAMVIIQAVFPRERMGAAFGVFSSMVGLSAVVYGVIEGQRYDWGTVRYGITIPEIIGAGLIVLAAFVAWERRHSQPLVPLGLFRSRTFAIMVLLNLAVQFALQSMLLVNSINLQSVLGFTAVHAGLTALPLTLALTALAPFAGRLTDRFGGKYVLMTGLAVYAIGIAGVAAVSSVHATSLTFAPVLVIAGLGMGAIFAPLATEAMRAAPPQLAGAASGVLNTGRQLGGTFGGAITGAVLASQLAPRDHRSRPAAILPRGGPGRAAAQPAAGRAGRRGPGVRPGRPRPVPAPADARRAPRPGGRLRRAGPGRPGGRGGTQVRALRRTRRR